MFNLNSPAPFVVLEFTAWGNLGPENTGAQNYGLGAHQRLNTCFNNITTPGVNP